jgi:pimeloyl-ACP methyl ester carboxylesterase
MPDLPSGESLDSNIKDITCYGVPGLGATGEIFERLKMPDRFHLHSITWECERKGETLADYAGRLLPQIDQSRPFIIAGFSFGGPIAVELAKICRPIAVVIVSGVVRGSEIPFYLKYLRAFHAYKLAPIMDILWTPLIRWGCGLAFGTRDRNALDLLTPMIQKTDASFYIWGLEAMMDWRNEEVPQSLLKIHGSKDRLLPLRYVKPDIIIKGGGHFIVYTHGPEIGAIIGEWYQKLEQTH